MPVVDEFKTLDEIDAYLGGSTIECLICGGVFQQLGNHIRPAHTIDCAEYKEQFGIPRTRKLVSARLHEKLNAASAKMILARGDEWEECFKKKGEAARGKSNLGNKIVHVPAVKTRLREIGLAGCNSSHKKYKDGLKPTTCPDCGVSHQVPAWASFRKDVTRCPACKKSHMQLMDRNRPNKKERNARHSKNRRERVGSGESISTLGREIFEYVVAQNRPVKTKEIVGALYPKHSDIKKVNFKKRISDLLISGHLLRVKPGIYLSPKKDGPTVTIRDKDGQDVGGVVDLVEVECGGSDMKPNNPQGE